MILGIGNDIIEIARIKALIDRYGERFLDRIFTKKEQEYCLRHQQRERHFAGRFAAKEAISKALGTGFRNGLSWLDLEICNDENGKPYVNYKVEGIKIEISISHCREYATAIAVVSKANGS